MAGNGAVSVFGMAIVSASYPVVAESADTGTDGASGGSTGARDAARNGNWICANGAGRELA